MGDFFLKEDQRAFVWTFDLDVKTGVLNLEIDPEGFVFDKATAILGAFEIQPMVAADMRLKCDKDLARLIGWNNGVGHARHANPRVEC